MHQKNMNKPLVIVIVILLLFLVLGLIVYMSAQTASTTSTNTGNTGSTGNTGNTGSTGSTGSTGNTGSTGTGVTNTNTNTNTNTTTTTAAPTCNTAACNGVMKDYIVNKYWAFADSANVFGDCKNCGSRWFRSPMDVSKDGTNYTNFPTANDAYNFAAL